MDRPTITPALRRLIIAVVAGGVILAAIGFVGSYAAVRELAEAKGFGTFALAFPIGIDAGIGVLLALDLVMTWLRMPYPLLRQAAWTLTAATIAFNGAAAWPDPLAVGMHAVIPLLFIVVVEAGRHAVGRTADITADKHMEGVRLTRWFLSPVPTFLLWRRMKLWELRSYEQVIKMEQDRIIYRAALQGRYGRGWKRKAPIEELLPLRLARKGVPLPSLDDVPALTVHSPLPAASASFDVAAAEAVALAPPAAPALVAAASTAPAIADLSAPAFTAPVGAQPQPGSSADAPDRYGALIYDLAPMLPPHPDVRCTTAPTDPTPDPDPGAGAQPRTQSASASGTAFASDAELIERARELALTGPLSLRRLQRELGIAQRRAQRVIRALSEAS